MRLYVAGPMRGKELYNWPAFEAATRWLRFDGHDVVTPTEIDEVEGLMAVERGAAGEVLSVTPTATYSYEACMARDLDALDTCEGIVMLPGWVKSEGALTEFAHACRAGLALFEGYDGVPPVEDASERRPGGGWRVRAVAAPAEVRVVDPGTGGAKGSKPSQLGWVAPAGLQALGEVAGFGASKYSPTNFRRGYRWSLSINAAFRHLTAIAAGEDIDPESGLPHAAHLAWHGCTLTQFLQDHPGLDDRHGGPAEETS